MLNAFCKNKIIIFFSDKVKIAFLFGSANTKYFNKKSNIDVAVWLKQFPVSVTEISNRKNN